MANSYPTIIRRICVEKLRAASRGRELPQNPQLHSFLWWWGEWTTLDEVRTWLASRTENAKRAVWLLTVLLGEMHSWGHDHRVRYYIQLSVIELFADVPKLTEVVGQLNEAELSKKEAIAVREFKKALQRRAEGKSDEAWKTEDDYEGEELND
jgi:hypothetical protein